MANQDQEASAPPASERTIRRLLGRAAKRRRPYQPVPSVPFGTEADPNREFSRRKERSEVWFFVFLPIFMLLFAIVEKMHVRQRARERYGPKRVGRLR